MIDSRNTLYVYRNYEEFNQYFDLSEKSGKRFYTFAFAETKELIESEQDCIIDITGLVEYLNANRRDLFAAINNFSDLYEDNTVIVAERSANLALELFPTIFSGMEFIFERENSDNVENIKVYKSIERKILYYYKNREELSEIEEDGKIVSVNNETIVKLPEMKEVKYCDITTLSRVFDSKDGSILYLVESMIANVKDKIFIVREDRVGRILEELPLFFKESKYIGNVISVKGCADDTIKKRTYVDLEEQDFSLLEKNLQANIIGHTYLKEVLINALKNFRILNKIGDMPVFSMLLYGMPGIGKTEICKCLSKFIQPDSDVIKINFEGYSSKDALNSLIGSPAGYVGCDGGELPDKVERYNSSVIICDEFDKTTSEVKNYFLQMLEEGKFTDSMGKEYDINGYIVIFTSNLDEKNWKEELPKPLISRLDLICKMDKLNELEKEEYIRMIAGKYFSKIEESYVFDKQKWWKEILKINCATDDLREIKKEIQKKCAALIGEAERKG